MKTNYTDTFPGAPHKFHLQPWGAVLLHSALCSNHLALSAVLLEPPMQGQLSCTAGRSLVSKVKPWEQTAFVAFWEEPQDPSRSCYCKISLRHY